METGGEGLETLDDSSKRGFNRKILGEKNPRRGTSGANLTGC